MKEIEDVYAMFYIEESPTGITRCNWCKELIKKGTIRLRFAGYKGSREYWHQDCGIKYLEGLIIMLQNGEKGYIDRKTADNARKNAGL